MTLKTKGVSEFAIPYLIAVSGDRVQAKRLPSGEYGAYLGPWRRKGDEIVGELDSILGNWTRPCVCHLRKSVRGWTLEKYLSVGGESRGAKFMGRGIRHLVITTRSYDLQVLNLPHGGPLLLRDSDCYIRRDRSSVGKSRLRRTPLYDFDQFVSKIKEGEFEEARRWCAPGLFQRVRRYVENNQYQTDGWHATCPNSYEIDDSRIIGLWTGRGETSEFLSFRRSGAGWKISGFRRLESLPKPPP